MNITTIPLKHIKVAKKRGRKDFSDLPELIESIKERGLIHPITVNKVSDTHYNLIAGERRYRSVVLLGWTDIMCSIRNDITELEKKLLELQENTRRRGLDWSEEIELLRQIDEAKRDLHGSASQGGGVEEGWNIDKTAEIAGISKAGVSNRINFAKLLKERPELKDVVKNLPLGPAMRKAEQFIKNEELERRSRENEIKLVSELKCGDACELIKELADESIDLIVTDPPFGNTTISEQEGLSSQESKSYTAMLGKNDNLNKKEVLKLFDILLPELFRVLKPSSHLYLFFDFELHGEIRKKLIEVGFLVGSSPLIWDKMKTSSPFLGYEYAPCYEPIMFVHKPPRTRRLKGAAKQILPFKTLHATKKCHAFQKPDLLLQLLISQSSRIGEIVLDPFAGSASTLIAARRLKRSFIGYEKDKKNFLSAQRNLLETLGKDIS